jgi:hypothetical protein
VRERGSAVIEGVVAMAIAFLLLTLMVQGGALLAAREAAQSAVAATARRAARPGADLVSECDRLQRLVAATVPGAGGITVSVERLPTAAEATAAFRWTPPGPDWAPVTVSVDARAALVIPP